MNWRDWFGRQRLVGGYHNPETKLTIENPAEEERYQAFKARLVEELAVDVHNSPHYGVLIDRSES